MNGILKGIAEEFNNRKFLIIGLIAGLVVYLLLAPVPESALPEGGKRVIALAAICTVFFLTEAIPLPAVALFIGIYQVIFVFDKHTVAQTFMSDSVFFIMGSLMIGVAFVSQGLDKRIAHSILTRSGTSINRVVLGIVTSCAILAAFVAEHTVAAMMLPVGMILVTLGAAGKECNNLGKLIMFSIAYGCSIGGMGTPSGGSRNAIMIEYWNQMFGIHVGYFDWMLYALPMVLIMIPITTIILLNTFKPEVKDLAPALERIREEVEKQGKMSSKQWSAVGIFLFILILWMIYGTTVGLGTIALLGAVIYLTFGFVKWNYLSEHVSWGTILLYAGAISMGVAMVKTGAATWLALSFLEILKSAGMDSGIALSGAISFFLVAVTNTMSNGAAVALTGPITLNMADIASAGDTSYILFIGFITSVSSAFAYLMVIGTPPATIIYSSGYIKPIDYIRGGWKMTLASIAVLLILSSIYWPSLEGLV